MDPHDGYQMSNSNQIEIEGEDFFRRRCIQLNSPGDLFKKLDGFVTLGEFEQPIDFEENMMHSFQLDEEKDFHLEKIFDDQVSNKQHPQNHLGQQQYRPPAESQTPGIDFQGTQMIFMAVRQQQSNPPQQRYPRKGSNNLPSFPDLLDKMIENFIENFNPNSFQEYNRYQVYHQQQLQEAMNNIPNFLFLETNLRYPYVFNNFHSHYLRFIDKMRQYHQQQRLDFKQMISFVCSMGLEFISDVLNVIKKADSAWCFETLKKFQEQQMPSTQFLINESSHKQGFQSQSWGNKEQEENEIAKTKATPIVEMSAPLNEIENKKSRKQWTQAELSLINQYIEQYHHSLPQTALTQLCQQLNRTPYSVQSKIHKMKKLNVNDPLVPENQSVIGRSFGTSSDSMSSISGVKNRQGSKYECSLEDMIKVAINQLPDLKGTKEEILEKIRQIFFPIQADTSWMKSVTIILSSNRSMFLKKLKGTFRISQQIPQDQIRTEQTGSLKLKLYHILQMIPGQQAEFKQIFTNFIQQEGLQLTDENSTKVMKRRLNQTLIQSNWFDKTKTCYCLASTYGFVQICM